MHPMGLIKNGDGWTLAPATGHRNGRRQTCIA